MDESICIIDERVSHLQLLLSSDSIRPVLGASRWRADGRAFSVRWWERLVSTVARAPLVRVEEGGANG